MSPRWYPGTHPGYPHLDYGSNKALGWSVVSLLLILVFTVWLYLHELTKPKIVMSPPPCTAQYSGYIYKDAVTAQLNVCTSHTTYSYTPILTHTAQ